MSETVGEGVLRIRTDESGVDVAGAGRRAGDGYSKGFGLSLKSLTGIIGGVLAAGKVLDFTKDSIAGARESNKIAATSAQVIKATGGAANLSADQIGSMATALSDYAGVDDEVIQGGQNLLLTFKNVKNAGSGLDSIFTRATKAGLDLAATGFGSVEGNAKMLGKALNDPVKGISALSRAGVTFTAQQQEQIKSMVKNNDLLGAQKVILGEVEKQVGGVAGKTATNTDRAKVAYGNLQESFGNLLIPTIDEAAGVFSDVLAPAIQTGIDLLPDIKAKIKDLVGDAQSLISGFAGSGGGDFLGGLLDTAQSALPVVRDLLTNDLLPAAEEVFGALQDAAQQILPVMAETFQTKVLPAVKSLAGYLIDTLVPVFHQIVDTIVTDVIPTFVEIATFLYGTVYPAVIDIVTAVAQRLVPVFTALVDYYTQSLLPALQGLVRQFREELLPVLEPLIEKVLTIVGTLAKFAASVLAVVLPVVFKFAGFLVEHLFPVLGDIVVVIAKVINAFLGFVIGVGHAAGAIAGFVTGALDGISAFGERVGRLVTEIPALLADLPGKFRQVAKDALHALLDGFKGGGNFVSGIAGKVWDVLKGLINNAIDAINDALEFKIPIPGAPDVNINLPNIPHLARGTSYFRGGTTWVGEEGPELLTLPRGSQVMTAQQSAASAAGLGADFGGVYINQLVAHDYADFTRQRGDAQRLAQIGGRRAA